MFETWWREQPDEQTTRYSYSALKSLCKSAYLMGYKEATKHHLKKNNKRLTLDEIRDEADIFFEFPTANRNSVTTTSAILFASHMMNKEIKDKVCTPDK